MVRVNLTKRGTFTVTIRVPVRVVDRATFADILDRDEKEIDTDALVTFNDDTWPDGIYLLKAIRGKRTKKEIRESIAHEVRAHLWDTVVDAVDRWKDMERGAYET